MSKRYRCAARGCSETRVFKTAVECGYVPPGIGMDNLPVVFAEECGGWVNAPHSTQTAVLCPAHAHMRYAHIHAQTDWVAHVERAVEKFRHDYTAKQPFFDPLNVTDPVEV